MELIALFIMELLQLGESCTEMIDEKHSSPVGLVQQLNIHSVSLQIVFVLFAMNGCTMVGWQREDEIKN